MKKLESIRLDNNITSIKNLKKIYVQNLQPGKALEQSAFFVEEICETKGVVLGGHEVVVFGRISGHVLENGVLDQLGELEHSTLVDGLALPDALCLEHVEKGVVEGLRQQVAMGEAVADLPRQMQAGAFVLHQAHVAGFGDFKGDGGAVVSRLGQALGVCPVRQRVRRRRSRPAGMEWRLRRHLHGRPIRAGLRNRRAAGLRLVVADCVEVRRGGLNMGRGIEVAIRVHGNARELAI